MCMSLDLGEKLEYMDRIIEELPTETARVEIDTTTFALRHQVSKQLFKDLLKKALNIFYKL